MMMAAGAVIFTVVFALTAWAIFAPRRWREWLATRAAIVVGGAVIPVALLTALLIYEFGFAGRLLASTAEPSLRIAVIGERWWWRVHYLNADGTSEIVSANEIRIPVGAPTELALTTSDVIHSFWAPNLGGKLDMIPGRENRLTLTAARAGTYRGQCAEFCGAQHALMAFDVVALAPQDFDAWLSAEGAVASEPQDPTLAHGQEIFLRTGCGACHTIRGIDAAGTIGPDLTHVGSRTSLAAGTLPNDRESLKNWILHAQEIKPGNFMPSFQILAPEDLEALAAYLESLK
jgi:cytochrome c oxidase subunit 2